IVLVRNQPGLHAAVKQAVDHEVIRRLELPTVFFQIHVMPRIHFAPLPLVSCSPGSSGHLLTLRGVWCIGCATRPRGSGKLLEPGGVRSCANLPGASQTLSRPSLRATLPTCWVI